MGVLIYELLTGHPPFKCDTPNLTLREKQKRIEMDILAHKISYPDEMSFDAQRTIEVLLSPNSRLRPDAWEITKLPFFSEKKLSQRPINTNVNLDGIGYFEEQQNEYSEKIRELEQQNQQNLQVEYELGSQIRYYKQQILKTEQIIRQLKTEGARVNENQYRIIRDLKTEQQQRIDLEQRKLDEVNSIINQFYYRHFGGQNMMLSLEQKLQTIFTNFSMLKKQIHDNRL